MKKKSTERRRNKKMERTIVLVVTICFFVLVFVFYKLVLSQTSDTKAIYGERLDGIEEVKISKTKKEDIENSIKEVGNNKSVKVTIQGKIINVMITINDDVTRDSAKGLADKVLEKLSEDEKRFYDIQVFIKKDVEDAQLPIIGYHHPKKNGFSWTLDR